MKLRMLESVTRVREMQLPDGRIYIQPFTLDAGNIYELAPVYAQKLLSSGMGVSVDEPPLPARMPSQIHGASTASRSTALRSGGTGIFFPRNLANYA
jgi:hypothetical protein